MTSKELAEQLWHQEGPELRAAISLERLAHWLERMRYNALEAAAKAADDVPVIESSATLEAVLRHKARMLAAIHELENPAPAGQETKPKEDDRVDTLLTPRVRRRPQSACPEGPARVTSSAASAQWVLHGIR